MILYPLVALASLFVVLKLSEHVELRQSRWIKIILSLPIILAEAYIVQLPNEAIKPLLLPAIVLMLLWIAIWRANIAFLLALLVTNTINGSTYRITGFEPDFSYARRAMKAREFDDAIALIETELEKDLSQYEGICMLYQALNALGKFGDAVAVMEFAVEQDYSPAQKDVLQRELQQARMDLFNSRESSEPVLLIKSKILRPMLAARPNQRIAVD